MLTPCSRRPAPTGSDARDDVDRLKLLADESLVDPGFWQQELYPLFHGLLALRLMLPFTQGFTFAKYDLLHSMSLMSSSFLGKSVSSCVSILSDLD